MNKDFLEIKMERAAKSGNVDEIKLILDTSRIKEKIDGLGRFSEEEASTFITKSINNARYQNIYGEKNIMKKRLSISAGIAAACILCTAGAYASGIFTNKFFIDDGKVTHIISNSSLSSETIDNMISDSSSIAPQTKNIENMEVFSSIITENDMETKTFTDAQEAQKKTGLIPIIPEYLPEDFSEVKYQADYLKNSDSTPNNVRTILNGKDNRRISITQSAFDTEYDFTAISSFDADTTDTFHSANGTEYYVYSFDGVTTYMSGRDNKTTSIHFTGLSQKEIEDVLNSIE